MKQEVISTEEFKARFDPGGKKEKLPGFRKGNKYGAKRTEYTSPTVGQRIYDSKREAARAAELDLLRNAGEILWWLPQVPIPLPGGRKYFVDFLYQRKDLKVMFEDVKGAFTKISKLKIDQVRDIHGIDVAIVK